MYTTKLNVIQWHPVAIFGTTPKHNIMGTSIFVISTSNLEHNFVRFMALGSWFHFSNNLLIMFFKTRPGKGLKYIQTENFF